MRRANRVTGVAVFACCLVTPFSGWSVEKSGTAKVELLSALTVEEEEEVDFGRLINENGTCTMLSGGVLDGPANMGCTGQETPGQFTVSGRDGAHIEIHVNRGPTIDGVTFVPVVDGSSVRVLRRGDVDVFVVGRLELANATDGEKELSYTFTANYH